MIKPAFPSLDVIAAARARVAVPIFALLAAGVVVSGAGLVGLIQQPVALGILFGLVAGKVIGIFHAMAAFAGN